MRGLPGRRVVLAAYDGEESPHFLEGTMGSMYHIAHPMAPLASIDMMVCMDLCGAELSAGTAALVDRATRPGGVHPRRLDLDATGRRAAMGRPILAGAKSAAGQRGPGCPRWEGHARGRDLRRWFDFGSILVRFSGPSDKSPEFAVVGPVCAAHRRYRQRSRAGRSRAARCPRLPRQSTVYSPPTTPVVARRTLPIRSSSAALSAPSTNENARDAGLWWSRRAASPRS